MSKARQLADLGNQVDDGAITGTNMVINGAMQVAQRGNRSASGFTGSFYAGPDRWLVNRSGTGSTSFSQVSSTDFGGTKAAQATFLAAAGEAYVVTQRIEAANIAHLAGQTVTLSFWASGSSDAGSATLDATLSYATATDNFTTETTISSASVAYSGTAAYYTFTFTLPSSAANGVAVKFEGVKTDATGTFTLTFGGVQLEVGDTATPFEHRSYGDELQRCQRYFEIVKPETGQQAAGIAVGYNLSTTEAAMHYFYKVRKRTEPDFTVTGQSNIRINHTGVSRNISSGSIIISSSSGVDTARMILTGASGSMGDGDGSSMSFVGDGSLQFNAEL